MTVLVVVAKLSRSIAAPSRIAAKKNPHAVKFSVRILAKSAIVAGSSLVDSIRVIDDIAYSAVNSGVIHGIDFKCDKGVLPHKFEVYLVVFAG